MSFFHVTTLSNFTKGYDKYTRTYGKETIESSTFPDKFFLLKRNELNVGYEKTQRLLKKIGLKGDRPILISIESDEEKFKDHKTGVGCYVKSPRIKVSSVSWIEKCDGDFSLKLINVEEAISLGFKVTESVLLPWVECKPRTVSVLPIAYACQASCKFCFSKASVSSDFKGKIRDWTVIQTALESGKIRGSERAVITGGGEPCLLDENSLNRLISLSSEYFKKVVLITNGGRLGDTKALIKERLEIFSKSGLSTLSISCHHYDNEKAADILGLRVPIDLIAEAYLELGLPLDLRFICVLQKEGVESQSDVKEYLNWASMLGVRQVTFKELYISTGLESAYSDMEANRFSEKMQVPLSVVTSFSQSDKSELVYKLPWGAPVYRTHMNGVDISFAAYTEPSVMWERSQGIVRSWNVMADGKVLASLEDIESEVNPYEFL